MTFTHCSSLLVQGPPAFAKLGYRYHWYMIRSSNPLNSYHDAFKLSHREQENPLHIHIKIICFPNVVFRNKSNKNLINQYFEILFDFLTYTNHPGPHSQTYSAISDHEQKVFKLSPFFLTKYVIPLKVVKG